MADLEPPSGEIVALAIVDVRPAQSRSFDEVQDGLLARIRQARFTPFPGTRVPFLNDNPGWLLFVDLIQVLVLAAMASFFWRRIITKPERLKQLCESSQGFVYAVTMTGTTGKNVSIPAEVMTYLNRVRSLSKTPVCAGFGIRSREQVELLRGHVDGVVVGSALVEVLERGGNPTEWLGTLRPRR